MTQHEIVVRNAKVATASETFECDIGIDDGVITALSRQLPRAAVPQR